MDGVGTAVVLARDGPLTGRDWPGGDEGSLRAVRALSAWLRASREASEHTFRSYSRTAEEFIDWLQGQKGGTLAEALAACRPSDVSAWLSIRGGKATSAAQRLACLRSMFRALVADDAVPASPARDVKLPKGVHRQAEPTREVPVKALNRALASLPDTAQGRRDRAAILLMVNNGLRRAEVSGLRLSDLRLDDDIPSIRVRGKGRRIDVLPLRAPTVAALRAWLEVRDMPDGKDAPVFHSLARGRKAKGHGALTPAGVGKLVQRCLPGQSAHGLRVRFASTTYTQAGYSLGKARTALRHVSPTTSLRYLRVAASMVLADVLPTFGG